MKFKKYIKHINVYILEFSNLVSVLDAFLQYRDGTLPTYSLNIKSKNGIHISFICRGYRVVVDMFI